ncbi:hypothetical protein Tco_1002630 [Tanacetum coccineum]|uniref:Uncharacterized protein n=1 Tax=Tanacetum coccineum TaxID=301880 RepID=A0ABQ5F8M9_9ASTR
MVWLEICGELRSTTNYVHWEPMFILYCRRSMGEDYRIACEINMVALELNNVVIEKDQFLEELDSLSVRPVPAKTAEFLREIQAKDKETVEKLWILQREMELNARKKELFIEKLKGVVPQMLITELQYNAQSSDWIEVLCYYYQSAATVDRKFARQIYCLRGEIDVACKNRIALVEELEEVRSIVAPAKAAEFLRETAEG